VRSRARRREREDDDGHRPAAGAGTRHATGGDGALRTAALIIVPASRAFLESKASALVLPVQG